MRHLPLITQAVGYAVGLAGLFAFDVRLGLVGLGLALVFEGREAEL